MRFKKWVEVRKGADYATVCKQFNISLPFARLLRNRGICDQTAIENYLYGSLSMLADPSLLPDITDAVEILGEAAAAGAPVRIIGDYDVDGICASYILLQSLRKIGAVVDVDIPERKSDGYGLNARMVQKAAEDGIELILTCDNGISAYDAVDKAAELGLSVIVTDHHEVTGELPPADAVVDPKREDSDYAQRDICGAVVAWQVMRALYMQQGHDVYQLDELLPFAALASVCDVVPLIGDSRIIVKEGLKKIRADYELGKIPESYTGLFALIEASSLEREHISAYHLGFVLGPCINACGRLTSAKDALALLCEQDPVKAAKKAAMIRSLNEQRRQMTEEGIVSVEAEALKAQQHGDQVYVLFAPDCDETVAGIVAGRIRESDYRPTIVLTKTQDGLIRGSGRSVPGYDLFSALHHHADLFEKFGGHEQAAGLTIQEERIAALRKALNAQEPPQEDVLTEKVFLDMVLPFSQCSEDLVREVSLLEPCGPGNRRALFAARHVRIDSVRLLGKDNRVLSFYGDDGSGVRMSCVYFGDTGKVIDTIYDESGIRIDDAADAQKIQDNLRLTLAYTLNVNEYRGNRNVQAIVRDVLVEKD